MSRFFVAPAVLASSRVEIRGKSAHHMSRVLRLGVGDRVVFFDGTGVEADAVISKVDAKTVALDVIARREVKEENPLDLTVIQAALTGERASWLVEKLTELGVARVVFFAGERSVRARVAVPRLARIVEAAAQQCGRTTVPEVIDATDLASAIARVESGEPTGLRVFGQLNDRESLALSAHVERAAKEAPTGKGRMRAALAVGPESGFTSAEENLLRANGFDGVRLGPRTLRAESAGIVFAAILMHRLGDMR